VAGIRDTAPVAAMFVFAILFFGVMTDAGLLDPIVGGVLRASACTRRASSSARRCWRWSRTSTAPAR
jgi:hypothetical protein